MNEIRFKWHCSYQGSVWFEVWDETGKYELELRRSAEDYERKFYNGDDADWQRNVVNMIGVLRRSHNIDREVPSATLQAFNAWRKAEHDTWIAQMIAQPHRYGDPKTWQPSFGQPPTPARAAARYENGWIITATTGDQS